MKNILIVCTANKTRSVLAECIANKIARERGKAYCFKSAGIAVLGSGADADAQRIIAEMNIECNHIPTDVREYDLSAFDEIHVMTKRHKDALLSYYESGISAEKIFVLGIDDPSGKGFGAYLQCRDKLADFYGDYI